MLTKTEIKMINKANGGHFFDKGAMRFFNSRLATSGHVVREFAYFITSERFDWHSPRFYTIRAMDINSGEVQTMGTFREYNTLKEAKAKLAAMVKELNRQLSA